MAKINNFDYPTLSIDDALKITRDFKERLGGKGSLDSLANMLGHKDAKSGAFLVKIADLRKYGLVEGRGEIWVSTLAEAILYPKSDDEKNEKMREMVFNIELWKKLYERLGGKFPSSDFWIILQEVAKVDRATAQKEADQISKLYVDAIARILTEGDSMQTSQMPPAPISTPIETNKYKIDFEGITILVPKENDSIDTAIELLNMLKKKVSKKSESKK